MTTKVSQSSGSHEPVITQSLLLLILLQPSSPPCNLNLTPPRGSNVTQNTNDILSQNSKRNALITTSKRRMALLKNKGAKKSVTILHAVPETTASVTAPLPDQRDTTAKQVSSKTQIALNNQSPLSPTYYHISTPSVQSSNNVANMTSSTPRKNSLKDSIGIYKHGKIQWWQKDRLVAESQIRDSNNRDRRSRPKIHVVIPDGTRERPLPAIPFFNYPSKNHIATAYQSENAHDISPPSASAKVVMRDSIVSPLAQMQPVSFGQFQRSMSRVVRKTSIRPQRQPRNAPKASGSSADSQESDSASTYSVLSSETSAEADSPPLVEKRRQHYSVQNPITAGVFDSSPESCVKFSPPSASPPRQYAHHPPSRQGHSFQPSCPLPRTRDARGSLTRLSTIGRKPSKRSNRRRSLAANNGVIDRAINRTTSSQLSNPLRGPSPTLSEAENDLEERLASLNEAAKPVASNHNQEQGLTALSEESSFQWDAIMEPKTSDEPVGQLRKDSVTIGTANMPPPALPRKSSKRQSSMKPESYRVSRVPRDHIASQISQSQGKTQKLTLAIPQSKTISENLALSTIPIPPKHTKRTITPTSAERVILTIFHSLDCLDDLFATAVVDRGFHRVFKRHELDLIKSTLRKMSPPAWEFREIAFPGHDMLHEEDLEMMRPQEEYTPSTYLQLQKRDFHTIRCIKTMIKEKCQSFVRPEISIALISNDLAVTARVDNALWRIWTFCKIFGSGKGREEDIIGQQDWLRGGLLVHQPACTFSVMNTDYMNDTLVGAPECFAKGNEGGLTAEELFDMMELWNCLAVLLQGFEGRTAQAREYGIYENTEIRGGDIDGEEHMLDEWCYYLLTFGLSSILELAGPCLQMNPIPFKIAAQHGWNDWKPPVFGGSRRNFLKEAASRVYEDKIAHTYATTSTRDIQRQMSKQRIQNHITELRHRKTSGPRMPMVHMSEERPMSEWSTVITNLTRPRPLPSSESNIVSHIPTRRSALAQELTSSISELPATNTPLHTINNQARALLPPAA
ncbi:hypothetical protein GQ44DRAFT_768207 [Phaeosphaeriaceae sp. PMI808]|nr:hypothetical protein GQ44DRAFT_768207 [Phaeosphaeriaceae sp. PMI808]